jgi:asparagine synthase (glutamine-hydrolysing)
MCGIAGELLRRSNSRSADWDHISRLMHNRGPDDSGIWSSSDGQCTLVFRRLSILDLSPAGHQPMVSPDDRYVLVFNGEIYNYQEIRAALLSKGVTFRSTGDSEVVLKSLIEWGANALERFNGMFALGFYDKAERRLLLARDHAGIKPLYYLNRPDGVVFASQYDQIIAHPLSRGLPVSNDALGLYLRLAYVPAPFAWLQDTYMLEPGTWVEFSTEGKQKKGRFFEFSSDRTGLLTGEEAIELLDQAITSAVKRQLISDVPVGAFLSGGIDSPLVVAKMRTAGTKQIQTFTIGTGKDPTDESADAARYAHELGVGHVVEQVQPEDAISMLDAVVSACGEPFGDYSIFPTMLVSRIASRKYKVMLSGDGGDELFWGYAKRFGSLIRQSHEFKLSYGLRRVRWGIKKVLGVGSTSYEAGHHRTVGDWQRDKHTHLKENLLTAVFPGLPQWPHAYHGFDYDGWETGQTARWLRWNEFTSHLTMVLLKVDRASMFHSLEVRVPLLDREVIAAAAQIDWNSCLDIEAGQGKLPLRQLLKRHIRHQTHAKRGFEVPMGKWLRTSLRPIFEETLLNRNDLAGLEIDRRAIHSLFESHLKKENDYAWGLWPLLSLALWERRYH